MKRFRVAQIEGTRSFFRQPPQFHYIRSSTPYCHPKMHSATRHLLYEIQSFHLNNLSSAVGASLSEGRQRRTTTTYTAPQYHIITIKKSFFT